jgi:hypothetical protein
MGEINLPPWTGVNVRLSVHGPKKTGRSPTIAFESGDQNLLSTNATPSAVPQWLQLMRALVCA